MTAAVIVHEFTLGDVEDPYLMAGFPLGEFMDTEPGQWLKQHAEDEMVYHITPDVNAWGYRCTVTAVLSEQDQTYYRLRYG